MPGAEGLLAIETENETGPVDGVSPGARPA